jgi:hypothetical protein
MTDMAPRPTRAVVIQALIWIPQAWTTYPKQVLPMIRRVSIAEIKPSAALSDHEPAAERDWNYADLSELRASA